MTFPLGIVKDFRPVFDKNYRLRFAMPDKYVNGERHHARRHRRYRTHSSLSGGMALATTFVD
jgi:hypothetical protein